MNRIDNYKKFKTYFDEKYSNFDEMNIIFSFRRYFLGYDLEFEKEDFETNLYMAIREETNIVSSYFNGYMNLNPNSNDIARIDYEYISNQITKINLTYLNLYKIVRKIELALLTKTNVDISIEDIAQIVKESKIILNDILINSIENLEQEVKKLEDKDSENNLSHSMYQ